MIRAVERALSIFEAFTPQQSSLSLMEIGTRTNLSKATAYRLVSCLDKAGYLVRLDNQQYCLSLKLLGLAGIVRSTLSIRDLARPIMTELVKLTGETITLNTVVGDERLCIEVHDTPAPLMTIVKQGERAPLIYGATGKILLAHLEQKRINQLAARLTAAEREAIRRQLERFRQQGYAMTRSERVAGVTAISVPIHDMERRAHYSLSVTGPSVRIDPARSKLVPAMLAAGVRLSAQLGGNMGKSNAGPVAGSKAREASGTAKAGASSRSRSKRPARAKRLSRGE
jgi:DNA-binding IclR family transcriptional regulator